jgi:hypothetical protein
MLQYQKYPESVSDRELSEFFSTNPMLLKQLKRESKIDEQAKQLLERIPEWNI